MAYMDCCADLDGYSGRQQQYNAHQRRIGARVVLLRMILHDRTKLENFASARELRADFCEKYEWSGIGIPDEGYTCVIKAK